MPLFFTFLGTTAHEMVYRVRFFGGPSPATRNLDAAGGPTPDLVTDSLPNSPIGRLVRQAVADQAQGQKIIFGVGLDGESTVPPVQLGEAYLQGGLGNAPWDLDADTDGLGHLRLTVTGGGGDDDYARLRIRFKHTVDR